MFDVVTFEEQSHERSGEAVRATEFTLIHMLTTTFWLVMISSVELRREKLSMLSSRGETWFSSSKKNDIIIIF